MTEQQPTLPKKSKRVQAPRAAVWLVFVGAGLAMEAIGLRDRNGWGPLSNAVWVVSEDGPHGLVWWLIPAALGWAALHFMFPGVDALGWRGLLWFGATAVFMWVTGRLLGVV